MFVRLHQRHLVGIPHYRPHHLRRSLILQSPISGSLSVYVRSLKKPLVCSLTVLRTGTYLMLQTHKTILCIRSVEPSSRKLMSQQTTTPAPSTSPKPFLARTQTLRSLPFHQICLSQFREGIEWHWHWQWRGKWFGFGIFRRSLWQCKCWYSHRRRRGPRHYRWIILLLPLLHRRTRRDATINVHHEIDSGKWLDPNASAYSAQASTLTSEVPGQDAKVEIAENPIMHPRELEAEVPMSVYDNPIYHRANGPSSSSENTAYA
jgi:hypothetical protein